MVGIASKSPGISAGNCMLHQFNEPNMNFCAIFQKSYGAPSLHSVRHRFSHVGGLGLI